MIQLNDTTYSIPGLGDRLMAPLITLGGKDPKKFAPNLNIGYDFGGGEEYYDNLNRTDKIISAKSEVKHDGKKVRLIEGSDIDEIYTDDLGRVKWDVVFEKCPETFSLEWKRTCSPGLTAHYQDSLENEWKQNPTGTLEEFLATNHRPEDVIGSYAIYCDKAHNWIRPLNRNKEIPADWQAQRVAGAELGDLNIAAYRDYKTGKVSHRYRPFVIDADGKTAWCTLLIIGNIERITLPEDFMKSAKYPVTLDPTFGYTSVGASEQELWYGWRPFAARSETHSASTGDEITQYAIYGYYASTAQAVEVAAYSMSSGDPVSRLADGVNIALGSSAGWCASDVVSQEMSDGVAYCIAFSPSLVTGSIYIAYDSQSNAAAGHSTAGALPDTWSVNAYYEHRRSLYATYTESGGASIVPLVRHYQGMDMI